MIILLHGEDTYRMRRKMREIMDEHREKHKSGLNLRYLEGKTTSFDDLRNEMLGISMFKEKKLIVVSDLFPSAKLKEEMIERGKAFADSDNVLLLVENSSITAKDKLLAFLEKEGKVQEFESLGGVKLAAWVKKEIEESKGKIDEKALEKLIEYVGGDLWQMENEIRKLANYSKEIKEKDVEAMVKPKYETNVFDTIDAIAAKNKKKAIELLKEHAEKGDSPLYLLAMVASQIRNIIAVKSGSGSGMHPFVLRKATYQAKNFTIEDLKRIYQKIVDLDFEIKVGKIDQDMALDVLISEI
ncbi:MAG: DNA polymerase III subunit delta [Candidatus Pacebacteria bacterium]|nr:DNA polymerase III subunit delta [Candidatus Paceibacterota bacterium]